MCGSSRRLSATNKFGGYTNTFPKGKTDGAPLQASAIKEAFEEAGLQVELLAFLGHFERTTSLTRHYLARRVGGSPADMGPTRRVVEAPESAEISTEDDVLHGRLLFIKDVISYTAETPKELEAAFQAAVDDYLETCAEMGDEADKPFKGTFNVRLGPELHRSCALAADHADCSLNDWVKSACKEKLESTRKVVQVQENHVVVMFRNESEVVNEGDFSSQSEPRWTSDVRH